MRRPIPGRELLGDQSVGRRIVRDSKQRFGDAHEGNALLIRQTELLQESVQERPLVAPCTRTVHQRHGHRHRPVTRAAGQLQTLQQPDHGRLFGAQTLLAHGPANRFQVRGCRPRGRMAGVRMAGVQVDLPEFKAANMGH